MLLAAEWQLMLCCHVTCCLDHVSGMHFPSPPCAAVLRWDLMCTTRFVASWMCGGTTRDMCQSRCGVVPADYTS